MSKVYLPSKWTTYLGELRPIHDNYIYAFNEQCVFSGSADYIAPTPSPTPTQTTTPTLTPTMTSTVTPTISLTPSLTPSLSPTQTQTQTASPTLTPSLTPTNTPSLTPTLTPSVTPSVTPNAVCPEQIINTSSAVPTSVAIGTYDRIYVSNGTPTQFAYLNLTGNVWTAGPAPSGNYPFYSIFTNGFYYTLYAAMDAFGNFAYWEIDKQLTPMWSGGTYVTSAVDIDFNYVTASGVRYPQQGPTDLFGCYFEYPSVCPTTTPSPTQTMTPSITPSLTPSVTPTQTLNVTPSVTPTLTPTITPSGNFSGLTEADAYLTAVVNAGGTGINSTVSAATRTLFTSLVSNGLYDKITAMYPMLGGSAASCKFNAKNPIDTNGAFRLTFNGGWSFSSSGATGNNSNSFAKTYLTGSTLNRFSQHLSCYVGNTTLSPYCVEVGCSNTTNFIYSDLFVDNIAFGGNFRGGNINAQGSLSLDSTSNSAMTGYFVVSRTSDTVNNMTKNGSVILTGSTTTTGTIPFDFYLGARNNAGTLTYVSDRRIQFATIGSGLTTSEITTLSSIVNTWATSIGRNTY